MGNGISVNKNSLILVHPTIICSQSNLFIKSFEKLSSTLSFEVPLDSETNISYICPYCYDTLSLSIKISQKIFSTKKELSDREKQQKLYVLGLATIILSVIIFFIIYLLFDIILKIVPFFRSDFFYNKSILGVIFITLLPIFIFFFFINYFLAKTLMNLTLLSV